MVTISDDCTMKIWNSKTTGAGGDQASDNDIVNIAKISTETTTCVTLSGT